MSLDQLIKQIEKEEPLPTKNEKYTILEENQKNKWEKEQTDFVLDIGSKSNNWKQNHLQFLEKFPGSNRTKGSLYSHFYSHITKTQITKPINSSNQQQKPPKQLGAKFWSETEKKSILELGDKNQNCNQIYNDFLKSYPNSKRSKGALREE